MTMHRTQAGERIQHVCYEKAGVLTAYVRRELRGETHGQSKLTEADVHAIRDDTRPYKVLAHEYGVSLSQIGRIKRRELWRHI